MYPGQVNSRETITTSALNATDTTLTVLDAGLLPDAPNLLVLGAGSTAETVLMTAKTDNVLTLVRGFQGVPKTWNLGTVVSRNFTEYDYGALVENITDVEGRLVVTDNKVAANTSAIGQIANDRGYLNTKLLPTDSDFNSIPKFNGKYMLLSGVNSPGGKGWFFVDVTVHNETHVEQKARTFDYPESNYRNFQRNLVSGTWTSWKETATEANTQIIKNIPAGVTKIENLPMGLYRIWSGSQLFSDYPPLAKKMSHEYGILRVVSDNANYKTYSLIGVDADGSHSAEYIGFSATGGSGTTAIRWSGVIPYSVNAAGGITIISQNNYILDGTMHINMTVRKTDNSNFAVGVQYSIAECPNLVLTYPKNVIFTGWNLAGNVLIGSGGVGTICVDKGLYVILTSACGVLRITGEFLIE